MFEEDFYRACRNAGPRLPLRLLFPGTAHPTVPTLEPTSGSTLKYSAMSEFGQQMILRRAGAPPGQEPIFTQGDAAGSPGSRCRRARSWQISRVARFPAEELSQHRFRTRILPFFDPPRGFSEEIARLYMPWLSTPTWILCGFAARSTIAPPPSLIIRDHLFGLGVLRVQIARAAI